MTELGTAEDEKDLYRAILSLKDEEECFSFFRDLCTPAEIKAMKERWRVAQLLEEGKQSYRQISESTGVSIVTITRVARFLKDESYQGYRLILNKRKSS